MTYKSRTLRKIALRASCRVFCAAFCLLSLCPRASAQFIGYTSPQTVQQVLANGVSCTGAAQTFNVANIGQTQHLAYLTPLNVLKLTAHIEGLDSAGNAYQISDDLVPPASGSLPAVISASGYFPIVRVVVTCTGTSFTLNYSGASATNSINAGSYMLAQSDKTIFAQLPANANQNSSFHPPFLNAAGKIRFTWASSPGPAGSTIGIYCGSQFAPPAPTANNQAALIPLDATANTFLEFVIPPISCPFMQVFYTSGGASVQNFQMDYTFFQPSFVNMTDGLYAHITGTTATSVKTFGGVLTQITVGTAAAGTVTITDLSTANCTGTPATNVVSVLTIAANAPPVMLPMNLSLNNGICVKASVAMDLTVGFQ